MSKYKYEGFGVIRNTETDFPYHTDDIAELLEEKDQQISDLEAKLAEKEDELNSARVGEQFALKCCNEAKEQLAEREKEIEKLNACVDFYKSYSVSFQEKVIDELEKVKELMRSIDMPNKPELYNNDMFGAGFDSHYIRVKELIDNQIKQLKEQ